MSIHIPQWTEYELLDSGQGSKLERFRQFTLSRPEPQATWPPALPPSRWDAADARFVKPASAQRGDWQLRTQLPARWQMQRNNLKFWVRLAPSGHVGVFPDQACHWDWIDSVVRSAGRPVKLLTLFAHTGLATLTASAAGAEVTHIDASRKAVSWARDNHALSGLAHRPVRWIVDDALTFVTREARRNHHYDAIILDPPRFGRGAHGEIWKLDDSLPELLAACALLLTASPAFVLLNLYTTVLTQRRIQNQSEYLRSSLKDMLRRFPADITAGELAIDDAAGHRIFASVFARAQFTHPQKTR